MPLRLKKQTATLEAIKKALDPSVTPLDAAKQLSLHKLSIGSPAFKENVKACGRRTLTKLVDKIGRTILDNKEFEAWLAEQKKKAIDDLGYADGPEGNLN